MADSIDNAAVARTPGAADTYAERAAGARVLLIDDDRRLCESLQRLLQMEGFAATSAHNAQDGLHMALEGGIDLIVLDVMLPGGDGRTLLKKLRTVSEVPVLMLTARGDEKDRISGLEAGADDYLPKPFHVRELIARMRAITRRRGPAVAPLSTIRSEDVELHPASRGVRCNGREISLTGTEFEVLLLLVRSAGTVVSRDEIAEVCLGRPVGAFDRSVDNHISNLRRKLGPRAGAAERILSMRGAGYILTVQAAVE